MMKSLMVFLQKNLISVKVLGRYERAISDIERDDDSKRKSRDSRRTNAVTIRRHLKQTEEELAARKYASSAVPAEGRCVSMMDFASIVSVWIFIDLFSNFYDKFFQYFVTPAVPLGTASLY